MNIRRSTLGIFLALVVVSANGQGTFIYDQQSSMDETSTPGGMVQLPFASGSGDGQSFTPTFSSVGFVRLLFVTGTGSATCYVNLRSASINGPIIGTSDPATANAFGPQTFFFSSPISVTPGTAYYFEPVEPSGTPWNVGVDHYNYGGGTAYYNGASQATDDYWFREGIIVPEPSSAALLVVVGGGVWITRRRIRL